MEYRKSTRVSLKAHPEFNEKWLQEQIVGDVPLLGLGDLDVKDIERRQPGFGRLDMLLFDPESSTRYEVEIQLGATDESHIIRTLEYWDNPRRERGFRRRPPPTGRLAIHPDHVLFKLSCQLSGVSQDGFDSAHKKYCAPSAIKRACGISLHRRHAGQRRRQDGTEAASAAGAAKLGGRAVHRIMAIGT
jgi:hypothetical protein